MDALYAGQLEHIPPGSSCAAVAYSNFSDRLESEENMSTLTRVFLHTIDTVALLKAAILRIQSLTLPVTALVLSGH